ncbi:MAG: peptidoglycan-binding protein [Sodalinema sp.]|uniref:peptidoglycan-binding domain-containing protein n=1 Tax=Sodalinema sp. TaxID=3080550 RepID=UPI00120B84CA|nr:MAG: peptidoglycan-binding protein [Phormidium sp. SL48-SHIP]
MPKLILNHQLLSHRLLVGLVVASAIAIPEVAWTKPQTDPSIQLSQASLDLNPNRPLLRVGSNGSEVRELQAMLQLMGFYRGTVTGEYGEQTARAVSAFQQAAGIDADGVVGIQTWNRLFPTVPLGGVATPVYDPLPQGTRPDTARSNQWLPAPDTANTAANSVATPASRNLPVLSSGDEGSAVVELQLLLQDLGIYQGEIDGIYQSSTIAAVERFQSRSGLSVDGVVGPMTWNALLGY